MSAKLCKCEESVRKPRVRGPGRLFVMAFVCAIFGSLSAPAMAVEPIDGTYLDSGGYVEIRIARCGDARCGQITRIIRRKAGASERDEHNDNPDLRSRPILGIRLLTGLTWERGAWRGRVYNPEDGGTYRAVVRPGANGSLEVEGCLGPICRKRIWPARHS